METISLKDKVFAWGLKYRILFKVLGSSTAFIVYVAISSSSTKIAKAKKKKTQTHREIQKLTNYITKFSMLKTQYD